MRVYYNSTTDSTAYATLLFEIGQQDSGFFDASSDRITTPPLTIPTGNYVIVENVDASRAGTNDIRVIDQTSSTIIASLVVERGV